MISLGATILALVLGAVPLPPHAVIPLPPQDSARPAERPAEPKDLPLIVIPGSGEGSTLAVLVTGDGGWAALDRGVSAALSSAGVPVIGFNSLRYFWTRRTPEEAAGDMERVLRYYLAATGRRDILLVGYSRGADVLPFMVARLSPALRQQVRLVALLGPGHGVDFKFHLTDWWKDSSRRSDRPVLPEVTKLLGETRLLCVYGAEDTDTICPELPPEQAQVVRLEGAHHFDGGYPALGELVLRAATLSRS